MNFMMYLPAIFPVIIKVQLYSKQEIILGHKI